MAVMRTWLCGVLRGYINFRCWCRGVLIDAGLLGTRTAPVAPHRPTGRGIALPQQPSDTEVRLANLEREIAELRSATAALEAPLQRHARPRPASPVASARYAGTPRTVPRPRALALGLEDGSVLDSLAKSARPPITVFSSVKTPPIAKPVSQLTCDEVAISLLHKFGG